MRAMVAEISPANPCVSGSFQTLSRRPGSCCSRCARAACAGPTCTSSTGSFRGPAHRMVPGHQIVGVEVDTGETLRACRGWVGPTARAATARASARTSVTTPASPGYDVDGGYAELMVGRRALLPAAATTPTTTSHVAPLLCAGLIGFRALTMCGDAERIGPLRVRRPPPISSRRSPAIRAVGCSRSRAPATRAPRRSRVRWAPSGRARSDERPPDELDAAIIFAAGRPAGPRGAARHRQGWRVVCGGIHMSDIPSFPYELLWERAQRELGRQPDPGGRARPSSSSRRRVPVRTRSRRTRSPRPTRRSTTCAPGASRRGRASTLSGRCRSNFCGGRAVPRTSSALADLRDGDGRVGLDPSERRDARDRHRRRRPHASASSARRRSASTVATSSRRSTTPTSALTCRVYRLRDGRYSPTPDPDDVRDALRAQGGTRPCRSASVTRRPPSRCPTPTARPRRSASTAPPTVVIFTCNHCPYALAWHDRLMAVGARLRRSRPLPRGQPQRRRSATRATPREDERARGPRGLVDALPPRRDPGGRARLRRHRPRPTSS